MKKYDKEARGEEVVATPAGAAEAAAVAEENVAPQPTKKQSRIAKVSFVWTIISMIFAIASGVTLITKNWILAPYSYIMLGFLAAYAVVFIVVVALNAKDSKTGKSRVKNLKKLFGIFKLVTNIVFLVVTAMSMVGVVQADTLDGLWKWIVIGANIAIAGVQLGLKITLIILKAIFKKKGQQYAVRVATYVNGLRKDNNIRTAVHAKLYNTEKVTDAAPETPVVSAPVAENADSETAAVSEPAAKEEKPASAPKKQQSAMDKIKLSGQKAKEYAAIAKEHAARAIADMKAVGKGEQEAQAAETSTAVAADREEPAKKGVSARKPKNGK